MSLGMTCGNRRHTRPHFCRVTCKIRIRRNQYFFLVRLYRTRPLVSAKARTTRFVLVVFETWTGRYSGLRAWYKTDLPLADTNAGFYKLRSEFFHRGWDLGTFRSIGIFSKGECKFNLRPWCVVSPILKTPHPRLVTKPCLNEQLRSPFIPVQKTRLLFVRIPSC